MHPLSSNLWAYFAPFSILHDALSIVIREFDAKAPVRTCAAYNSPVLEPCAGTVWRIGQKRNIQWTLGSNAVYYASAAGKSRETRPLGIGSCVILAKAGIIPENGVGSFKNPVASGFDMEIGCVEVTVPCVDVGGDYQVVVVGSEDDIIYGEMFTIEA